MTEFNQTRLDNVWPPSLALILSGTMFLAGTLGGLVPGALPVPRNGIAIGLMAHLYSETDFSSNFKWLLTITLGEVVIFWAIVRFVLTMLRSAFAIGAAAAMICTVISFRNWVLLFTSEGPSRGGSKMDEFVLLSVAVEFVVWTIVFTLAVVVVRHLRGERRVDAASV